MWPAVRENGDFFALGDRLLNMLRGVWQAWNIIVFSLMQRFA